MTNLLSKNPNYIRCVKVGHCVLLPPPPPTPHPLHTGISTGVDDQLIVQEPQLHQMGQGRPLCLAPPSNPNSPPPTHRYQYRVDDQLIVQEPSLHQIGQGRPLYLAPPPPLPPTPHPLHTGISTGVDDQLIVQEPQLHQMGQGRPLCLAASPTPNSPPPTHRYQYRS